MASRITSVSDFFIRFENGSIMTFDHDSACCEWNYADFEAIDSEALSYDFDLERLTFEACDGGFRFGDHPEHMFFVPCYSEQNGYYSADVDIYLNGNIVLTAEGEEVLC